MGFSTSDMSGPPNVDVAVNHTCGTRRGGTTDTGPVPFGAEPQHLKDAMGE